MISTKPSVLSASTMAEVRFVLNPAAPARLHTLLHLPNPLLSGNLDTVKEHPPPSPVLCRASSTHFPRAVGSPPCQTPCRRLFAQGLLPVSILLFRILTSARCSWGFLPAGPARWFLQQHSSRASFPLDKQISFCTCPGCLHAQG